MSCYLYVIIHLDDARFGWVVSLTDVTYSTCDVPLRGSMWSSSFTCRLQGRNSSRSARFVGSVTQRIGFRDHLDGTTEGAEHFHLSCGVWERVTFLVSHRLPKPLSEGGSIKSPACSVNFVNSLLSLLMDPISHTYISLRVLKLWRMINCPAA